MYNVLLADDEVLERTYLRYILEKSQLCRCVFEASNGQEAVELTSRYPVDVIFMDVRMPVMNGLEAIQAIKREHPDIVVIVNSAYAEFDFAKEAMHHGANAYLLKPTQGEEILATLEEAIKLRDGHSRHEPEVEQQSEKAGRSSMKVVSYPYEVESLILEAIDSGDQRLIEIGFEAFNHSLIQGPLSLEQKKTCLYEFLTVVTRALKEDGHSVARLESFKSREFESIRNVCTSDDFLHVLFEIEQHIRDFVGQRGDDTKETRMRILNYVEEHVCKNISLSSIAQHFHYSPTYLSRLIKEETGLTFPQLHNYLRVKKALVLLKNSNLEVGTIAKDVGYHNICHFNRIFKNLTGITPSEYRRTGRLLNPGWATQIEGELYGRELPAEEPHTP